MRLTDEEVRGLLLDPDCPYARFWEEFRAGAKDGPLHIDRPISVEALKDFALGRYGESTDLERQLDLFVEQIGGRRLGMIDPWSAPRRALRRLAGKKNPSTDMYEIPARFFELEASRRER